LAVQPRPAPPRKQHADADVTILSSRFHATTVAATDAAVEALAAGPV
jgi:hypothetical protein